MNATSSVVFGLATAIGLASQFEVDNSEYPWIAISSSSQETESSPRVSSIILIPYHGPYQQAAWKRIYDLGEYRYLYHSLFIRILNTLCPANFWWIYLGWIRRLPSRNQQTSSNASHKTCETPLHGTATVRIAASLPRGLYMIVSSEWRPCGDRCSSTKAESGKWNCSWYRSHWGQFSGALITPREQLFFRSWNWFVRIGMLLVVSEVPRHPFRARLFPIGNTRPFHASRCFESSWYYLGLIWGQLWMWMNNKWLGILIRLSYGEPTSLMAV